MRLFLQSLRSTPLEFRSTGMQMKSLIKAALAKRGLRLENATNSLSDLPKADRKILEDASPYTMTSLERRASLLGAVEHIVRHGISGDIVECGVWRGGSMAIVASALMARGDTSRQLHLYDTFEGMSAPTEKDWSGDGESAQDQLDRTPRGEGVWCEASLEDVQNTLWATNYPRENIHFVKGKVEDTIPTHAPSEIAILRLDTDWYESTRHELMHLYPRLSRHGVLIIDDYGHWQGAREAVDEYFAQSAEPVFLHRVDYTARLVVKQT